MNNFDHHKWQEIKEISAKLQAILSLLQIFNSKMYQNRDFLQLQKKLEIDFLESMQRLIEILESDPD
jgi:hypothetical protein